MRVIKALAAVVVLLAVVVGPPWALITFIGNPWPAEGVSLSTPLTDGAIIGLLAVVVWVLWLQLLACIATEAIAAITDDRVQLRVPLTLGVQQQLARRLVTAVVVAAVPASIAVGGGTAVAAPGPAAAGPVVQAAEQGGHDLAEQPIVKTEKDAPAKTTTVPVKRLDTLWDIAERVLGDGDRWPEIAALNEGQEMNDGATFTSADRIRPGWELVVPDEGRETAPAVEETVTVDTGDTLSEIALEQLGDADRYPEIFEASTPIEQPGGKHLADPDVIDVGWTLNIPAAEAGRAGREHDVPETPVEDPEQVDQDEQQPAPQQDETQDAPPQQHRGEKQHQRHDQDDDQDQQQDQDDEQGDEAPGGDVPPVVETPAHVDEEPPAAASATDAVDDVDEDDGGWPIMTLGGVGALLAAALVGLITRRRNAQRRVRKPGARTPLPAAAGMEVEREVRAVADGAGLDNVDVALRSLALHFDGAVPALRLARFTGGQLDLFFVQPVTLPAPWRSTEDPAVWMLDSEPLLELDEPSHEVAAPYPALVSIGVDAEDAVLLLNLAELGSMGLVGNDPHLQHAVTALALELASTPWTSNLELTVVGSMSELASVMEPGRIRYVPAVGGGRLSPTIEADLMHARQQGRTVVFLDAAGTLTREQHDALRAAGASVVARGWFAPGAWILDVPSADAARLLPVGLEVTPQLVDEGTYQGLYEVLSTSLEDPNETVQPEHEAGVVSFDRELANLRHVDHDAEESNEIDQVELEEAGDVPSEPADEDLLEEPSYDDEQPQATADAANDAIDHGELSPGAAEVVDEPEAPFGVAAQPEPEEEPAPVVPVTREPAFEPLFPRDQVHPLLATGHPVVRLLGQTVDVVNAAADAPRSTSHLDVCTRIAAYLILNRGTSRPALVQGVWGGQRISDNTVSTRLSNLRAWLGTDPETGIPYLPARQLRLLDLVVSDWDVFTHLVGQTPTAASTTSLESALELVRGAPISGEESKEYAFVEDVLQEMTDLIADSSYELARRRFMEGSWHKAGKAAEVGTVVDPGNERLWRIRIHAAHAAGRPDRANEAVERMRARISELGFDLEPETVELVEALQRHDSEGIEQAREAL